MGLISWLGNLMGGESVPVSGVGWCNNPQLYEASLAIRELAFESAANMIANSISKCEFRTFVNNEETKGPEYYRFNVAPNKNQNSSAFLHKLIYQFLHNNEALVVDINGDLLVADSFSRKSYALYDDVFTGVTVGDLAFESGFTGNGVMYFQLNNKNIKKVTDALYISYSSLIGYGIKAYQQSQGRKGTLTADAMFSGDKEKREDTVKMVRSWFDTYFSSDNAVLPLPKGYEYKENESKTYGAPNSRDVRAMIDDVSDFTCKAFGIPPALLRGNVEGMKDAMDMYLTFCIDPIADQLSEEINRKRNGMEGFLKGNRIQIDTTRIKHIDIFSVAPDIEKMISSGVQSVNDIRRLLDEPPIDEGWADQHFITKNFTTIDQALEMQGGDAHAD